MKLRVQLNPNYWYEFQLVQNINFRIVSAKWTWKSFKPMPTTNQCSSRRLWEQASSSYKQQEINTASWPPARKDCTLILFLDSSNYKLCYCCLFVHTWPSIFGSFSKKWAIVWPFHLSWIIIFYHLFSHLQKDSILKATWPEAGVVDQQLIDSSEYLMNAAHSFRLQRKNYLQVLSKKNKKAPEVAKPNKGLILVAKTFPPWQSIVLSTMLDLYQVFDDLYACQLLFKEEHNWIVCICFRVIIQLYRITKRFLLYSRPNQNWKDTWKKWCLLFKL